MIGDDRLAVCFLFAVALAFASCCAAVGATARQQRGAISPILVNLLPGASQRFTVQVEGHPARAAKWLVNDIAGGSAEIGRITRNGLYRAPARPPVPNEVHIGAMVEGVENPYVCSTVLVGRQIPYYRLSARWGEYGEGAGQFLEAHGIALDADGNVLIADPVRSRVMRFATDGKFLGELGLGPGSALGAFQGPPDVQVGPDGHILVLDRNNNRVQEFTRAGQFVRAWGQAGSGTGQFNRPHSIAFGKNARVYVADTDNDRIQVFDRDGKFLFAWAGSASGLRAPHAVAVDRNGDVFVLDYYGMCQKFTADGKLLFSLAQRDETCHSLASDRWGDVYLMARHPAFGPSIVKYNNDGAYITRFAVASAGGPGFYPKCAVVDAKGRVLVTETDQHHVAVDALEPE